MIEDVQPSQVPSITDPLERSQTPWRSVGFVGLLVLFSTFYAVGTAGGRWDRATAGLGPEHHDFAVRWFQQSTVAEVLVIWWVAAVSGTIGSFLNVIVYRMPRDQSLSGSGSKCVHCQTPIKWYDNQPVLGWFLLRGRCRACHRPISGRYPLVESMAIVGGLWLFFAIVQTTLIGPAVAQPGAVRTDVAYYFWLLDPIPAQRLLMFFYLLPPLMASLAIAWASYDGVRLPYRFYLTTMALCLGGAVAYDFLVGNRFAEWYGRQEWHDIRFLSPSFDLLVTKVIGQALAQNPGLAVLETARLPIGQGLGLAVGALIGWSLWMAVGRLVPDASRQIFGQAPLIFALLGLVGGWYLPLSVALWWSMEFIGRVVLKKLRRRQEHARPLALWFGLPFYFLFSVMTWRWFP